MKNESMIDIKVLLELYSGLVERYERIKIRRDTEVDASDFTGEYSYLYNFFKAQNTIENYDRRPHIDNAISQLCKFEQLVVDTEKGLD